MLHFVRPMVRRFNHEVFLEFKVIQPEEGFEEDFGELKGMDVEEGPEEAGVEKTPEEIFFEGVSDETFEELFGGDKNGVEGGVGNLPAVRRGRRPDCCRPTLSNQSF